MFTQEGPTRAGAQHHDYWDGFYSGRASGSVPEQPSAFARWVERQLPAGQEIVEIGFGTARDSLYFARQGRCVQGFDFAESAVTQAGRQACERELAARFTVLDLYDDVGVTRVAESLSGSGPRAVYGRFLVH